LKPGEGTAGEAFRTRSTIIMNNYAGWSGASAHGRRERVEAAVSVPLQMGARLLGVLTVHTFDPAQSFSEEDAWLLGLLGDQAAKALEQARLVEEAEQRSRRLLALHKVSANISAGADVKTALRLVVQAAVQILGRSGSAVYLWDETDSRLHLAESEGLANYPTHVTLEPGEGLVGQIWLTPVPIVIENYERWEHAHPDGIKAGNRRLAGVPLIASGRALGVLWVRSDASGPRFTEEDVQILELLSNQAAIAVENARLFEQAARARAIEELSRLKNEFVSAVSHELRTPLTYVCGYSELLVTRDYPAEHRKELANEIYQASGRMRRLVDDLLDLGRLESGGFKLRLKPLDLKDLIESSVRNALVRSPGREIRMDVGELPLLSADRDRLGQVVDNLLENAIRYAPDSPIEVRTDQLDGQVLVEVTDHGPGISASDQERIFEPFYRGENSEASPVRGGGLGLSIVKRLVEGHGGTLRLRSSLGHGSTFSFTLPCPVAE
jgi:K+-sensing histidine kinase KdpD